ncbi:hypothetical protein [Aerococcus sp. HMSC10H05]|uniref:hypothetical protein n=1 Tax=Aerococcus sp. HMSC10H05 TaxID=1581084 RepID=UPI0008A2D7C4|nr:hypothetical protein [Aerococcus sp. HMSC10H05]OFU49898.1 hypothetical protein HMPREF3116_06690 [Aerococcus sp. HMSC10H05]
MENYQTLVEKNAKLASENVELLKEIEVLRKQKEQPTLTKSDILKVKDTKERQKLIAENMNLFK